MAAATFSSQPYDAPIPGVAQYGQAELAGNNLFARRVKTLAAGDKFSTKMKNNNTVGTSTVADRWISTLPIRVA